MMTSESIIKTLERIKNFMFDPKSFKKYIGPNIWTLAIFGIACAVVGHYATTGFSLLWFLFFELPLYIFCGWALWKAWQIYKRIK